MRVGILGVAMLESAVTEKAPIKGLSQESASLAGATDSGDASILRRIKSSCQVYRQPDTLLSTCACNGAACHKTKAELLTKMGPYRALPVSHIGTMWRGDPSTSLVYHDGKGGSFDF